MGAKRLAKKAAVKVARRAPTKAKKAAAAKNERPAKAAKTVAKPAPRATTRKPVAVAVKTEPSQPDFARAFDGLRAILRRHAREMAVTADGPRGYVLHSKKAYQGKPLFFGGAQVRASYVSYYLFPVYVCPELVAGLSPKLKKRMQGKSCFNLRSADPVVLGELAALTARGVKAFRAKGML